MVAERGRKSPWKRSLQGCEVRVSAPLLNKGPTPVSGREKAAPDSAGGGGGTRGSHASPRRALRPGARTASVPPCRRAHLCVLQSGGLLRHSPKPQLEGPAWAWACVTRSSP